MKAILLTMFLGLCSCSFLGTNNKTTIKESPITKRNVRDKEQVANCFIENVEYFRKYHRHEDEVYVTDSDSVKSERNSYYNKYPGADWDPENFFIPYSSRYSLEKEKYINSPLPTDSQLKVTTDLIVYSSDSLLCVAFLVIESKFDSIKGLENARRKDRRFDGNCIIGYRKSIENSFQIYPSNEFGVIGFEDYESTVSELKQLYFNHLKGGGSGGIYYGLRFSHNVGDQDFFLKSPYFKKHKSGLYNFMMYKHLGKEYEYNYQSCN